MNSLRIASLMLLSALPTAAQAALIGNPVAQPRAGRVSVGAELSSQAMVFEAASCTGPCEAVWRPASAGGRAELAILPGLGLAGGGSWLRETIDEASFAGTGASYWGGLEAALPLGDSGVYIAAVGQFERSTTHQQSSTTGVLLADAASTRVLAAGLLAWAPSDDSFALYGGAAVHPLHSHHTTLHSLDVELDLDRGFPAQGVLGLELRSAPLGLPWATVNGRMTMGLEARIERGLAGGLLVGAAF